MSNLIIWSNWIIKWFFNKMSWVKYFLVCCWSCSLDYIVLMSSYWILWQFSMLWYYHFLIFNSWDCTHFLSNITLISFFFISSAVWRLSNTQPFYIYTACWLSSLLRTKTKLAFKEWRYNGLCEMLVPFGK